MGRQTSQSSAHAVTDHHTYRWPSVSVRRYRIGTVNRNTYTVSHTRHAHAQAALAVTQLVGVRRVGPTIDTSGVSMRSASLEWDAGRHPEALRQLQALLRSSNAEGEREQIALLTGEN